MRRGSPGRAALFALIASTLARGAAGGVGVVADLSITKTDGQVSYIPGQPLTYTIVVTNDDTADSVAGATVADTIPADLIGASWTCAATPGSVCGSLSGAGDIATTVDLAALGSATFTLTATASASAAGSISNTASVAAPVGVTDPTPGNNSATDTNTLTTLGFYSVAPCRVLDTRNPAGPLGGPALTAGATRSFEMAGSCGIPANATAVFGNITVVAPTAEGHLRIEPSGNAAPNVSGLNYSAGQTRANNGVFALDAQGRIDIVCVQASGSAGVIVDVAGYFIE